MKKQKNISIKAKLLGSIIPVVVVIVLALVLISYQASAGEVFAKSSGIVSQ